MKSRVLCSSGRNSPFGCLDFSAASAADLPQAPPPAPIIAAAPIFTWTGFYAGVNAGWGWRDDNEETVVLDGPARSRVRCSSRATATAASSAAPRSATTSRPAPSCGVSRLTFSGPIPIKPKRSASCRPGLSGTFVPGEFDNNLSDWFGTVRARAGVAFDRVLVYATGGVAYTEDKAGWTVGGGAEWALPVGGLFGSIGSAATFGIEGLWVSFDEDDDFDFNRPIGTFTPAGGGAHRQRLCARPGQQ